MGERKEKKRKGKEKKGRRKKEKEKEKKRKREGGYKGIVLRQIQCFESGTVLVEGKLAARGI